MKKLIIVIVILAVLVGGYFVYQYFWGSGAKKITTEQSADGFKISSGNQSLEAQYIADPLNYNFGVGVYPGSTASSEQKPAVYAEDSQKLTVGTFKTGDSVEKVVDYYKKQFGAGAIAGKYIYQGVTYNVVKSSNNEGPIVNIFSEDNQTTLMIVKK